MKKKGRLQEGSAGKGACCQVQQPEFSPQETLHGGRKENHLPPSCKLFSDIHTCACVQNTLTDTEMN